MENSVYDFDVCTLDGEIVRLSRYRGSTMLIVNIASSCGFAEQMNDFEGLYQRLAAQNFVILGFPCGQFNQEPLDNVELQAYYAERQLVHFPLFQKIHVNGRNAHPLFKYLSFHCPGIFGTRMIKWNFTKFLVSPEGKPLARFSPITNILIIEDIIRDYWRSKEQH